MTRTITVIFDGETLRPIEPVDLRTNTEYRVTIEDTEGPGESDRPLMQFLDLAMGMGIPDLAEQHDHYLYGTPKR